MKVAFIGQKGIPTLQGGVERHVEELAIRLVLRGVEVIVYTRPQYIDKNLKEYKKIKLISLPTIKTKHLDALTHTLFACFDVRRRGVDVIHFHSIGPSLWIWLAKLLNPKTAVIATFHSQCYRHKKWNVFAKQALLLGEKMCCLASDSLIVVSRNLKELALKRYKRIGTYIPNGVPRYEKFQLLEAKRWGLTEKGYILSVGRLVESKGAHYLIESFQRLKTNKKLVIVGDETYSSGYEQKLKEMSKGNSKIVFTGKLDGNSRELAELFSNAYLFVQASEIEGLSIALLEAMSYGRATLVSDIPENLEAVADTGFSFKSGSIDDLTRQLRRLLTVPIQTEEMGKKGQKRVEAHYSWEVVVEDTLKVYQQNKEELCREKRIFPRINYFIKVLKRIF